MLDITGVLLVTPEYFAEQLEGPLNSVEEVMTSIRLDERHQDLRIVQQVEILTARFSNWRMLRFNGESAGEGGIAEIIATAHLRCDPFSARRLERLITTVADGRAGARM